MIKRNRRSYLVDSANDGGESHQEQLEVEYHPGRDRWRALSMKEKRRPGAVEESRAI